MRKRVLIAGLAAVIALAAVVALWPRPTPPTPEVAFELLEVGPTEVTIGWRTERRSRGAVRFAPSSADAATEPTEVVEPPPPTEEHRVSLGGLEPGTRYRYGLAGGELSHSFETQPLSTTPFSFLLLWGGAPPQLRELTRNEAASFVLSLSPVIAQDPDPYRDVRPSLPIFGPSGPSSRRAPSAESSEPAAWRLEWGGLALVLGRDASAIGELLDDASSLPTVGVVLQDVRSDLGDISGTALHTAIGRHNRAVPEHPVSFALLVGTQSRRAVELDGVVYASIALEEAGEPRSGAARVDVGADSTVMRWLPRGEELTLRSPPVRRSRSCKECRALADRGEYERSVRAYQEFIASNQGHFQVDDAHYAVAQILDERLFRFAEALDGYRKLVDQYPASGLVPLARQRIAWLTAHGDHDFEPLRRFERIRKVELARHKDDRAERRRLLTEVESIVQEFPRASLAPQITYWLANQLRQEEPDRAVATYRSLCERHPDSELAADARIEIGETYYAARRYHEAITAFREALAAEPERAASIEPQIARSRRNVLRGRLGWAAAVTLLVLLVPLGAWKPRGIERSELRRGLVAWLVVSPLTLIGGWLIHEQFSSATELLGLALAAPVAACFGYPVTASLGRKLAALGGDPRRPARTLLATTLGALLGLVMVGAASYLTIYALNEHYLTGFGL